MYITHCAEIHNEYPVYQTTHAHHGQGACHIVLQHILHHVWVLHWVGWWRIPSLGLESAMILVAEKAFAREKSTLCNIVTIHPEQAAAH